MRATKDEIWDGLLLAVLGSKRELIGGEGASSEGFIDVADEKWMVRWVSSIKIFLA